jgi:predicted Zn finger-like uncharacterized protein
MKITCQSCQAKYTIADDKVLGKIVKIRCKKCNETIVVNGSDPSGASGYSPEPGGYGNDDAWTVNVAEGDQRTMTDMEIVAAYQTGIVGDDTYCWKDGMGDWLPLREIDQLVDACNATRAAVSASMPPQEPAARMVNNAQAAGHAAGGNGSSANAFPQAARRAGGRAGADLFRGVAQAGSEEEVMTSAPTHTPQAHDEKPTGARNENSVLFSLAALTSKGQSDRPAPMPGSEQSGLIDIRQLSAQMGQITEKKQSRVDDIMNLTSGASYNQALSAPVLSAPALDQYGAGPDAGAGAGAGKSRTLIFAVIGGAFIIAAGVGATVMFARGGDAPGADTAASASAASGTASAGSRVATVLSAGAASAAAAPSGAAPSPSGANTANSPSAAAAAATATATAAAVPASATDTPATHPATGTAAAAPAPKAAAPAAAAAAAPAPKAAAPAAAPEADQPFNMGEAKAKLAAAAAAVQACKKADGPAGTGRVVVLFAPSGAAQSATISGAPFEGTPTGACVAARFRGVHVPAFSGSPFSVSKSFTIN